MNSEIVSTVKSRVIPFLNKVNYLGVYTEIVPYSFKNFYLKNLYMYFDHYSLNPTEDGVTLDGFLYFITNKVKTSRNNLNEKRVCKRMNTCMGKTDLLYCTPVINISLSNIK